MAASTQDRVGNSILRAEPRGFQFPAKLEAGTVFHMNTLVGIRNSDGFAEPNDGATTYNTVGVIPSSADTTLDSSDGDTVVELRTGVYIELVAAGMAQDDQGKPVYSSDNQTVSLTQAGTEHLIGKIYEVISATKVLVFIDPNN